MNFDFSEDQKLLQKTAKDYLDEHSPLATCRRVLESDAEYDEGLWKGVAEMGWLGACIPEEHGGAGFGHLELAVIAEEVGAALAPIPFGSSVYLATEALLRFGSEAQQKSWLPRLASGEAIGTLALPEGPGSIDAAPEATTLSGGALTGCKSPVIDGAVANLAVVLAKAKSGSSLALVDLTADGVSKRSLDSIDPTRSLAELRFEGAPAELLGSEGRGLEQAQHLLDRAAVLMAFEQLGGGQRSFDITHEQIMGRYAFGRPVASFQAVKHRMADCWAKLQLSRSNCYYGAWALSNEAPELGVAAALARVSATDAFELSAQEQIQLHGGVGYTWEYDCHLFYRRSRYLAVALGSAGVWREKLIQRVETQK